MQRTPEMVVGQRYEFDWIDWIDDEQGESMLMTDSGIYLGADDVSRAIFHVGTAEDFFNLHLLNDYYPQLVDWRELPDIPEE